MDQKLDTKLNTFCQLRKNARQQQLSVNQGCLLAAIPKPKVDTISSIYVQMGEEYIKAWYKWCTICSKKKLVENASTRGG